MALHETPRVLVICNEGGEEREWAGYFEQLPYRVTYSSDLRTVASWADTDCSVVLLSCDLPEQQTSQYLTERKAPENRANVPVLLVAPNSASGEVEKYLQLGADDFLFTPTTPALLHARIDAMLAISDLRHHAQDHSKDDMTLKLEHDLQVARQIQAGFLPRVLPQVNGWEISARFQPAREVAGDFYDAFMLSQNRRLAFVIADVVDKGIPAALFMALVRSLTRAFAQQNYALNWSDILGSGRDVPSAATSRKPKRRTIPATGTISLYNAVLLTNNYIVDNHMDDNMFATLFFGLLDPSTGQLAYINAGHNPPFIFDAEGNLKAALKNTGTAVGMFAGADYGIEMAQMKQGDLLFCYTDGVTEARAASGKFVTEKGLLALLAEPADSATKLLDRVDIYLQDFMSGAVQFDDITMMALRFVPS